MMKRMHANVVVISLVISHRLYTTIIELINNCNQKQCCRNCIKINVDTRGGSKRFKHIFFLKNGELL